jgi:hypothetical protein
MAFSGLAFNEVNTANLFQRDVASAVATLSPKETPILDWLGDAPESAKGIKHEFIEDFVGPNTIVASTAIASATAVTAFQVSPAGIGNALNVGQLLRNRASANEVMQITSIVSGGNSIVVSRVYDGSATSGSLAPGGKLYVGGMAGVEGAEHSGADTHRLGNPRANTLGLFKMELAQSKTQGSLSTQIGRDKWEDRKAKGLIDLMRQLENEVVDGVLNGTNSLGSATITRTMQGIRTQLTAINSTVAASSFAANPHLYVGGVWQSVFDGGGSTTETWGIIAGPTFYKNLSDLNDTKVLDSNKSETFQRLIRMYTGPFGSAEIFLSRVVPDEEFLLVPRERLRVPNLEGRSFNYEDMGLSGDNQKGLWTGEYTLELFHAGAMGRAHS